MRILIVDPIAHDLRGLAERLATAGHQPEGVEDGHAALHLLEEEPFDLALIDVASPVIDGIELLRRIKGGPRRDTDVVMMSSNGSIRTAVEAIKLGAYDFVSKPLKSDDAAKLIERVAKERREVRPSNGAGDGRGPLKIDSEVIGSSEAMSRVKRMVKIASKTDANVLIYGETGVGKDLVSSVIHRASHRAGRPFVKVGCALFPPSLIESELYGHEEGSFTGADQPRRGRFELAEGGTIYLDDVDDIPLEQQAKLLRAIEEKVYERVGGTKPIKANVRILASSKKNLLTLISDGKFREDLYYRLDVLRISVAPLRDRRQDVPALTDHLLHRIADGDPFRVDPQAVVQLAQHNWPGNVRELYHTLERAYLMGSGQITAELLENEMGAQPTPDGAPTHNASKPHVGGFQKAMEHAEKQLLLSALEACRGNKTAAATSLGMKPSTFRDRLSKHGIR